MRRYWLAPGSLVADEVTITGEDFHHIVDVCRQVPPAKFEVLMPSGEAYLVEMAEIHRSKKSPTARARVLEVRQVAPLPRPHIRLVLAVARFPVLEAVLEKCVELGVAEVQLVFSDHSFVGSRDKISDSRWERWGKIIRMATQQSGRGELMKLPDPVTLAAFLNSASARAGLGVFLYEGSGLAFHEWARQVGSAVGTAQELSLFIGAEGGFSEREVLKLKSLGYEPLTLGDQVLRVETACVSGVAILKYLAMASK